MLHRVDLRADLVEWVERRTGATVVRTRRKSRRRFARDVVRRSAATLLRHFRALDRIGDAVRRADARDLEQLLGSGTHDPGGEALRRRVADAGARGDHDVLAYLTRRAARNVELWPDA